MIQNVRNRRLHFLFLLTMMSTFGCNATNPSKNDSGASETASQTQFRLAFEGDFIAEGDALKHGPQMLEHILASDAAYVIAANSWPAKLGVKQRKVRDEFYRLFVSAVNIAPVIEADKSWDISPGFVGVTRDGRIIVALHGTRTGKPTDTYTGWDGVKKRGSMGWSTNLDSHSVDIGDGRLIHKGFYDKTLRLEPVIQLAIKKAVAIHLIAQGTSPSDADLDADIRARNITFTGHSQGGAVAQILGVRMKAAEPRRSVWVHALSPAIGFQNEGAISWADRIIGRNMLSQGDVHDPVSNGDASAIIRSVGSVLRHTTPSKHPGHFLGAGLKHAAAAADLGFFKDGPRAYYTGILRAVHGLGADGFDHRIYDAQVSGMEESDPRVSLKRVQTGSSETIRARRAPQTLARRPL